MINILVLLSVGFEFDLFSSPLGSIWNVDRFISIASPWDFVVVINLILVDNL